jgi:hypothetical protein
MCSTTSTRLVFAKSRSCGGSALPLLLLVNFTCVTCPRPPSLPTMYSLVKLLVLSSALASSSVVNALRESAPLLAWSPST